MVRWISLQEASPQKKLLGPLGHPLLLSQPRHGLHQAVDRNGGEGAVQVGHRALGAGGLDPQGEGAGEVRNIGMVEPVQGCG